MNFVFFSPYTSMWNMSLIERAVYKNLQHEENNLFIINCNEDLTDHCMVFNALKLDNNASKEQKKKICKRCISYKNLANKRLDNQYDIKNLLQENDFLEIDRILETINLQNFRDIIVFDLPVGQIALHDFILINKLSTLDSIEEDWNFYVNIFKTTLISLFAFKNFIKKNKVDCVISVNNLYSNHQVVAKFAEKNNMDCYAINPDSSIPHKQLQHLKIWKGVKAGMNHDALINWKNQKFKLTDKQIQSTTNYISSSISGGHYLNFSQPKNDKNKNFLFNKTKDYKKIISIILSGIEEDYCLESSGVSINCLKKKKIFINQIEWVKKIIEFSKINKDIFFIVRPHPREWLKIKNNEFSENYHHLKNLFDKVNNDNFFIDYPKYNINIYDHAQIANLFLTNGSSTFVDFSLLGFPIIDSGLYKLQYPHNEDFDYDSIKEYFEKVHMALKTNRSIKISEKYFRWFAWTNSYDTIDISSQLTKDENFNNVNFLYKFFSRILEHVNVYIFKNFELNKLNNVVNDNKIMLKKFFTNRKASLINSNLPKILSDEEHNVEINIEKIKKKIERNIFFKKVN